MIAPLNQQQMLIQNPSLLLPNTHTEDSPPKKVAKEKVDSFHIKYNIPLKGKYCNTKTYVTMLT